MRGDYGNGKFNNFCKNIVCEIDYAVNNNKSWTSATGRVYNGTDLVKYQEELYAEMFIKHQSEIEGFFKFPLTISSDVQVLEYTKDAFYKAHSDDSNMLVDNEKLVGFIPVAKNRKLTTVLFTTSYDEKNDSLNSFNGGELLFNFLYDSNKNQIKIKPKKGDMLVFLSNPYFTHEVLKIKSGYRLTLVQWHDALIN